VSQAASRKGDVALSHPNMGRPPHQPQYRGREGGRPPIQCYGCGGPHFQRECPDNRNNGRRFPRTHYAEESEEDLGWDFEKESGSETEIEIEIESDGEEERVREDLA